MHRKKSGSFAFLKQKAKDPFSKQSARKHSARRDAGQPRPGAWPEKRGTRAPPKQCQRPRPRTCAAGRRPRRALTGQTHRLPRNLQEDVPSSAAPVCRFSPCFAGDAVLHPLFCRANVWSVRSTGPAAADGVESVRSTVYAEWAGLPALASQPIPVSSHAAVPQNQ